MRTTVCLLLYISCTASVIYGNRVSLDLEPVHSDWDRFKADWLSPVCDGSLDSVKIIVRADRRVDLLILNGGLKRIGVVKGEAFIREITPLINFGLRLVPLYDRHYKGEAQIQLHLKGNFSNCNLEFGTEIDFRNSVHVVKRSTNVGFEAPVWVDLDENGSFNYIWLTRINSAYGRTALALTAGTDIMKGHEFVLLNTYESPNIVLCVPGLAAIGPGWATDQMPVFYQFRNFLRFSRRDAAWLLWDFETSLPMYPSGMDNSHFETDRIAVVPVQTPGLIMKVGVK